MDPSSITFHYNFPFIVLKDRRENTKLVLATKAVLSIPQLLKNSFFLMLAINIICFIAYIFVIVERTIHDIS